MPAIQHPVLIRAVLVGLGTSGLGLLLALAWLELWGFLLAALAASPAVRWVLEPDIQRQLARAAPAGPSDDEADPPSETIASRHRSEAPRASESRRGRSAAPSPHRGAHGVTATALELASAELPWTIVTRARTMPETRLSFVAWVELPPRHEFASASVDDDRPTPLESRRIRGPWPDQPGSSEPLLLSLRATRRDAQEAAARRAPAADSRGIHRTIVELEAASMRVVDARESLTDTALLKRDAEAWQLLHAIRDLSTDAVWIRNSNGLEDTLVLFDGALGDTMRVRDEAIYRIDADANVHRLAPVSGPAVQQERPPTRRLVHPHRTWAVHLVIAGIAAVIAHPMVELAGAAIGTRINIPVFVAALFGFAAGLGMALWLARRIGVYRRFLGHVLTFPSSRE